MQLLHHQGKHGAGLCGVVAQQTQLQRLSNTPFLDISALGKAGNSFNSTFYLKRATTLAKDISTFYNILPPAGLWSGHQTIFHHFNFASQLPAFPLAVERPAYSPLVERNISIALIGLGECTHCSDWLTKWKCWPLPWPAGFEDLCVTNFLFICCGKILQLSWTDIANCLAIKICKLLFMKLPRLGLKTTTQVITTDFLKFI